MRYRIEKKEEENAPLFLVTIFPGPYSFEATAEDKKRTKTFPFTEEGLTELCDYLNEAYLASPALWEEGKRLR